MTDEKWFTKKMRERFHNIVLRSFESCRVASVPDLYAIIPENGQQFWIEAKLSKNATSFDFDWSSGQEQWIRDFEGDGGKVFIAIMNVTKRQILLRSLFEECGIVDLADMMWAKSLESLMLTSL